MKGVFITATDTDAGKTHVASLLLKLLVKHRKKAVGFKPVAAGAESAFGELVNLDAITLIESGNVSVQYHEVNPYVFEPPIAPHIAAKQAGTEVTVAGISTAYDQLTRSGADIVVAEGAGGWALPLNDDEFLYQWVLRERLPVILVVGMKLGCLNHALLTLAHIKSLGAECIGWIANQVDPQMKEYEANLDTLKRVLDVPLLGISPYSEGTPKLQIYRTLLEQMGIEAGA